MTRNEGRARDRRAELGPELAKRKLWRSGLVDPLKSFDDDAALRRELAQKRSLTRDARHENPVAGHGCCHQPNGSPVVASYTFVYCH